MTTTATEAKSLCVGDVVLISDGRRVVVDSHRVEPAGVLLRFASWESRVKRRRFRVLHTTTFLVQRDVA